MAKKRFGDLVVNIPDETDNLIPQVKAEPIKRIMSFEQWWATMKLPAHLFTPLQTHMAKKGYIAKQDFIGGLKNFGL